MIGVTGASGRLGRLVVRLLLRQVDAAGVVALTRTPAAVAHLGVTTRLADFDDPAGLVRAFDGVDRMLMISTNVYDPGDRRVRQHTGAIRAAVRARIGHVVYTSIVRAGDPAHPAAVAADHRTTETVLADSGIAYTVLRHSMYTHLILAGAATTVATGMLLDNSGDGAASYVTREDCAAVAARVLAGGGHQGERLEVTGPRACTQAEIAALLTEYTGQPVRYYPISDEQVVADLVRHGMSEAAARRYATIGRSTREGYAALVTDVVERVTGYKPTSVPAYLAGALGVAGRYQ